MHFEDKKQYMPLDIDEIDRNGISCDSSFAEKKEKKLLCMLEMVLKKLNRKFFLLLHVTSAKENLSIMNL